MSLSRTFVGFSSTDIRDYWMMLAWKENQHIDFDFADCQLKDEIRSEDETYIKRKCRERINMTGAYIMLIGQDTKWKYKYVKWEAEVAIEKKCRIIGMNLDHSRRLNRDLCPPVIQNIGAIFISYSPKIAAYALKNYKTGEPGKDYFYPDTTYEKVGISGA